MLAFDGKAFTWTSPPFEIDVDGLAAKPIPLGDGVEVLEMASDGRALWALGKDAQRRLRLFRRASSGRRARQLTQT